MQSFCGAFQSSHRDVQAEQAREPAISQERFEQPALAAAEIRDARSAHIVEGGDHRLDALLIEIHRALEACLDGVSAGGASVGVEVVVLTQTAQGIASQGSLVAKVAAGDQFTLRMRGQPVAGAMEELVDLIVADPVVLFAVESRNQYGEMSNDLRQQRGRGQTDGVIARLTPRREDGVERFRGRLHDVAERLEEAGNELGTAIRRQGRDGDLEGHRVRSQLGAFDRLPSASRGEDLAQRNREEGCGGIGAVVDVLVDATPTRGPGAPASMADEIDRIDLDHECRSAPILQGFGVENMGDTAEYLKGLVAIRVLTEQIPEIGRRLVGGGDREDHVTEDTWRRETAQ